MAAIDWNHFFICMSCFSCLDDVTRIRVLTGAVDALNVRHARAGSEQDEASRSQSGEIRCEA